MIKKIAIVAATNQEILPLKALVKKNKNLLKIVDVQFHVTGVGSMVTCFFLTNLLLTNKYDFVFQVGIAGSYSKTFTLGTAVVVSKDYLADVGVLENNIWKDVFDMGFSKPTIRPFTNKALVNKYQKAKNISNHTSAIGITVNTITTSSTIKNIFIQKYDAQIESMEGAALHYVCNKFKIPYLQIRGLSNKVGERNKQKWQIQNAIESSNVLAYNLLCGITNFQ